MWHVLRERKLSFCKAVTLQFTAEQAGSLQCRINHQSKPLNVKGSVNSSNFSWLFWSVLPSAGLRRCWFAVNHPVVSAGSGRRTPSAGRTLCSAGLTSRRSTASSAARGTTTGKVKAAPPCRPLLSPSLSVPLVPAQGILWFGGFLSSRKRSVLTRFL